MNIDKKDFHKKKKFWWVVKDSHNYKQVHVNKKKIGEKQFSIGGLQGVRISSIVNEAIKTN